MTGEGLRKTERSNRPGFVVAPNEEDDTAQQHGNWQHEPGPEKRCQRQCLAQLGTTHQQDKEPGEVVIKLRVGDPLGLALPCSNACPMITVIGRVPDLARLGMERDHADEQYRTENSEDDRRPHTRFLECAHNGSGRCN
jgi:hypothetical protein